MTRALIPRKTGDGDEQVEAPSVPGHDAVPQTPLAPTQPLDDELCKSVGQQRDGPEQVKLTTTPYDDAYYEELSQSVDEAIKMKNELGPGTSLYYNSKSRGRLQVNGDCIFARNGDEAKMLMTNVTFSGTSVHFNATHSGPGEQINGRYMQVGDIEDKERFTTSTATTRENPVSDGKSVQRLVDIVETSDGRSSNACDTKA